MLRFIDICTDQIEMHKMLKTIRRNTCVWLQTTGIENIDGKFTNEIRCIDVKKNLMHLKFRLDIKFGIISIENHAQVLFKRKYLNTGLMLNICI